MARSIFILPRQRMTRRSRRCRNAPFFARYKEKTRLAGGGSVDVLPLEIVAETKR